MQLVMQVKLVKRVLPPATASNVDSSRFLSVIFLSSSFFSFFILASFEISWIDWRKGPSNVGHPTLGFSKQWEEDVLARHTLSTDEAR